MKIHSTLTKNHRPRHVVEHKYTDHSMENDNDSQHYIGAQGLTILTFPQKLHRMLDEVEQDGLSSVVSWQPHGRAFLIRNSKVFVEKILPKYFKTTKLTSFQRQLNIYSFVRITKGPDAGSYYHELFLRGKYFLCRKMFRTKVKGTGIKASSNPKGEPNFYKMAPVIVSDNEKVERSRHRAPTTHMWSRWYKNCTSRFLQGNAAPCLPSTACELNEENRVIMQTDTATKSLSTEDNVFPFESDFLRYLDIIENISPLPHANVENEEGGICGFKETNELDDFELGLLLDLFCEE